VKRSVAALAALALLLTGCGGSDDQVSAGRPAPDDIVAEVASFDLAVGPPTRIIVGVLTGDRRFVAFGTVRLRFAYLGTKEDAKPAGDYSESVNARFLPIHGTHIPSPLPSEPRIVTPSEGRGVYAAAAGFDRAGFWQVEVTADVAGREQKATAAFAVNERRAIPGPGDPAPATENLTVASTDAPPAAIDSRAATGEPPDAHLHQTTIASALSARRPVVAVFATPVYCQSQFCGPITDMVGELARTYGDRASFVHIEIWRDFQSNTINRAAAEWLLRNEGLAEPWVFVVGAEGRIVARFDNVATAPELEQVLNQLPVIGPPA
jgi:hypothetical protein